MGDSLVAVDAGFAFLPGLGVAFLRPWLLLAAFHGIETMAVAAFPGIGGFPQATPARAGLTFSCIPQQ